MEVGSALNLLSWPGILLAPNFPLALATRALAGLSAGLIDGVAFTYVSEISLVRTRGLLATLMVAKYNLAWFLCVLVSTLLTFRQQTLLSMVPALSFLALSRLVMKESPVWLLKMGKDEKAQEIIKVKLLLESTKMSY